MNAENQNDEFDERDWHDQFLDQALAEVVGGETPPDLSERIMAAAEKQSLTLSTRGETMNGSLEKHHGRRFSWMGITVAVAASLLAVALYLPAIQAPRELSRRESTTSNLKRLEVKDLSGPGPSTPAVPAELPLGTSVTRSELLAENSSVDLKLRNPTEESESANEPAPADKPSTPSATTPSPYYLSDDVQFEAPAEGAGQQASSEVPVLSKVPYIKRKFKNPSGGTQDSAGLVELGGGMAPARPQSVELDARLVDAGQEQQVLNRWSDLSARRKKPAPIQLGDEFGLGGRPGLYAQSEGQGPGKSGDQYTRIHENPFIVAQGEQAVSTFSIDVDTASYANVRQFLSQSHRLPPPDAVRIEELVNYFDYDYAGPTDERPFAAHLEVAACPWNDEHHLVRIGLKGREMDRKARPLSNLVFLVDVSGSMNEPNKLPLLVEGMKLLTRELGENDKISIVVYASSEGLALPSTRGDQQQTILSALDHLRAGGSTAGGAGIELAYKTATENFVKGGVNRVVLCTDGDFNVGVTSTAELERMAEAKAKDTGVFLTVLGFGRGNLNDAMMEAISGKGNGNYNYVDNLTEARKVLVEEMTGTLVTIAKDVKIQVEFNPAQVAGYRLLGYENRMLRTEDFNDDKKDAGEIGAGHTVTALYEIVPAGKSVDAGSVDPLKYQQQSGTGGEIGLGGSGEMTIKSPAEDEAGSSKADFLDELLTLKLRYKEPDGDTSTKIEFPLTNQGGSFVDASDDFRFAAAVASYGMLLRDSQYKGNATFDSVLEIAQGASSRDPHGYRAEFLELVRLAGQLAK